MLECLRIATGGHISGQHFSSLPYSRSTAPLQKRVLEMMRLHEEVGFEPKLQAAFIQAGGVRMLLDIVELGWPEGSNFAASEFEFDTVVELPVALDVELVSCSSASGQRHLGIKGQGQSIHRSLRGGALAAVAEMSNYRPIIDAISQDGRLFDASWMPHRLQQVLSQYKYGLSYSQLAEQRDQLHGIAERLLYLCANCSSQPAVAAMLNTHCTLQVVRTFRDAWQRKHEPLDTDYSGSSGPSLFYLPRRRLHAIPDSMDPRDPMTAETNKMAVAEAATDKMSYSFVRYITRCSQTATQQQMLSWNETGAIAKVCCAAESCQEALSPGRHEQMLLPLRQAWHEAARQKSLKHSREVTAVAAADAEELRRVGNAAYKAGALQEALNL